MIIEIVKFIIYISLIIFLSKFVLAPTIRKIGETLALSSKTIGNISGYATSMPEFLTIVFSSINGLTATSIYNVVSSNIINFVLYMGTLIKNKNIDFTKNNGIKLLNSLSVFAIIIPITMIIFNIELDLSGSIIFILIFIILRFLCNDINHSFFRSISQEKASKLKKINREDAKKIVNYIIILLITGIILFILGNRLGDTLEVLSIQFKIPEIVLGTILGLVTSIPELITFNSSQKHYLLKQNKLLGVVETTNNLLTSNLVNLFIIQALGSLLYIIFG